AAGVLLYSAMALGSGSTNRVPLWDKTFLIPVQMLGGLGAGMALSIGFAAITEGEVGETMKKYALVSAVLLAGSLLAIAATVLALDTPGVANMLEMTWLFIVGSIVVGLLIPIGLQFAAAFDAVSAKAAAGSLFAAGVLAVVGKLALAMTYLLAAEFTPLPLPV
ncbi:MAG: dehydrogenase, partial [Natronomonas sp.]